MYEFYLNKYTYPNDIKTYLQVKHEEENKWSVYLAAKCGLEQAITIVKYKKIHLHEFQNWHFWNSGKQKLKIKLPK